MFIRITFGTNDVPLIVKAIARVGAPDDKGGREIVDFTSARHEAWSPRLWPRQVCMRGLTDPETTAGPRDRQDA